jgi:hypothetical protein
MMEAFSQGKTVKLRSQVVFDRGDATIAPPTGSMWNPVKDGSPLRAGRTDQKETYPWPNHPQKAPLAIN